MNAGHGTGEGASPKPSTSAPSLFDGLDSGALWGEFARKPSRPRNAAAQRKDTHADGAAASTRGDKSNKNASRGKSSVQQETETQQEAAHHTKGTRRGSKTTRPQQITEPDANHRAAGDVPEGVLTDAEVAHNPLLTVQDLAAYARHETTLAALQETVERRRSPQYQAALASLTKSLGEAAGAMDPAELYELVDIALEARPQHAERNPVAPAPQAKAVKTRARQKNNKQKGGEKAVAARQSGSSGVPDTAARRVRGKEQQADSRAAEQGAATAKRKPAASETKRKTSGNTPVGTPTAEAQKTIKGNKNTENGQAKKRALNRYNTEDRIENAPLKNYLPDSAVRAVKTHLGLGTVGELLEYFPRKYLPRGELSSFAELVEGQEVTIIARVLNVSTRTMAARRGRITEVTITDTLAGGEPGGATGRYAAVNGRAHQPGRLSYGGTNPRVAGLAANGASYSGYADSYGQSQSLFGVPAGSSPVGSTMKLSFFNAWTAARDIHEGDHVMFSGKVGTYRGEYTLTNPHYAVLSESDEAVDAAQEKAGAPIPVYRAPVKLPTDRIASYITQLLEAVPLKELEDPVPFKLRRARKIPSLEWTYRALHTPDSEATQYAAQQQMRYREAFVLQVALARLQAARAAHSTVARAAVPGGLADRLLEVLPYQLTAGQQAVGEQIAADLGGSSPMNRLLQGDVGSGKTVVALRAMLQVADTGGQSAMLAPTEVLAEQHLRSVLDVLGAMADTGTIPGIDTPDTATDHTGDGPQVRVRLLTASMSAKRKKEVLAELADGTAQIVIGTHALLSEGVEFNDLGLVVVDEQHRFGVEQRDGLRGPHGELPHRLVMTATPIPRTVAMTVFGDLDVSVLDQLPAGRQKISTHVVPLAEKPGWASRLWSRAREEIDAGHQVYVVVPKIGDDGDDTEEGVQLFGDGGREGAKSSDGKIRLTSVTAMNAYLQDVPALSGVRIGTLHGRMDAAEKTRVMTAFERAEIDLLISTTVIEVGVNVPNATLMIIMDADRFGISGLHQLRGRVGRGGAAGTCLLVTRQEADGISRERLDAVAGTTDGFELSRIDLQQRREGDILGAAQSGRKSTLKFLRALTDAKIIERAREDARGIVADDPTLAKHPNLARTIDRALDADREAFLGRG